MKGKWQQKDHEAEKRLFTRMKGKWQLKDHEAEKQLFTRRLAVAAVIVALLFCALIIKLLNLQVAQYEYFSARSDGNRLHSQYVPPARGLIFDSQGELLADNQPIFNFCLLYTSDAADE